MTRDKNLGSPFAKFTSMLNEFDLYYVKNSNKVLKFCMRYTFLRDNSTDDWAEKLYKALAEPSPSSAAALAESRDIIT